MTADSPLLKSAAASMLKFTDSYPSQEKINSCISTGKWHELDQEVLKDGIVHFQALIVSLTGIIEESSSQTLSRKVYLPQDLVVGREFMCMLSPRVSYCLTKMFVVGECFIVNVLLRVFVSIHYICCWKCLL